MATDRRISRHYPFSPDTLDAVSDTAGWQNQLDFSELADRYGVSDGSIRETIDGKKIEYLRIQSFGEGTNAPAMTLFAPMGNAAISPNIAMRAIRLFGAHRPEQLFVFSGPSNVPNSANNLDAIERKAASHGDLSPVVAPFLKALAHHGVKDVVDFAGYSLGASLAQETALIAKENGIDVRRAVLAEPANVKDRTLVSLANAFNRSGKHLAEYLENADSEPLYQAFDEAADFKGYVLGLIRLGNIALARYLSHDSFGEKTAKLLQSNADVSVCAVYAENSEISGALAVQSIEKSMGRVPSERLGVMALQDAHHAVADDIDLHAAMVMDGLKLADAGS